MTRRPRAASKISAAAVMMQAFSATAMIVVAALPARAAPFCHTERDTQAYVTKIICVDSILASQTGNRYDVESLVDANPSTAWCEGEPGHGIGLGMKITLEESAPVLGLNIRNGYNKSMDHFLRNGRVKSFRLTVISYDSRQEPRSGVVTLRDEPLEQRVRIPWKVADPRQIRLEILSVYPGTRFTDTCVSDLSVDFGM